jgi:hypothetical protein
MINDSQIKNYLLLLSRTSDSNYEKIIEEAVEYVNNRFKVN